MFRNRTSLENPLTQAQRDAVKHYLENITPVTMEKFHARPDAKAIIANKDLTIVARDTLKITDPSLIFNYQFPVCAFSPKLPTKVYAPYCSDEAFRKHMDILIQNTHNMLGDSNRKIFSFPDEYFITLDLHEEEIEATQTARFQFAIRNNMTYRSLTSKNFGSTKINIVDLYGAIMMYADDTAAYISKEIIALHTTGKFTMTSEIFSRILISCAIVDNDQFLSSMLTDFTLAKISMSEFRVSSETNRKIVELGAWRTVVAYLRNAADIIGVDSKVKYLAEDLHLDEIDSDQRSVCSDEDKDSLASSCSSGSSASSSSSQSSISDASDAVSEVASEQDLGECEDDDDAEECKLSKTAAAELETSEPVRTITHDEIRSNKVQVRSDRKCTRKFLRVLRNWIDYCDCNDMVYSAIRDAFFHPVIA